MTCELCDKFWSKIQKIKNPKIQLEKIQMIDKINDQYDKRFGRPLSLKNIMQGLYIPSAERKNRYIHYKMGELN